MHLFYYYYFNHERCSSINQILKLFYKDNQFKFQKLQNPVYVYLNNRELMTGKSLCISRIYTFQEYTITIKLIFFPFSFFIMIFLKKYFCEFNFFNIKIVNNLIL
jgi:hypothetical protein